MLEQIDLLGRDKNNLQAFNDALTSKESLKEFKSYLPKSEELEGNISVSTDTMSNLRDQIKLTTSAFQSGLTSAADLYIGGFDTHSTHDSLHEPLLAFATDAIQLFWQIAEEKESQRELPSSSDLISVEHRTTTAPTERITGLSVR